MIEYGATISSLRVFGSASRGDVDRHSDHDLLAVVPDFAGFTRHSLDERISASLSIRPSVSIYTEKRLREIFNSGSLFAWHLHLESVKIDEGSDFVDSLGEPEPYENVSADLCELRALAESIEMESKRPTRATVYESGLLYLVARNAAIVSSQRLSGGMIFGRYAPFELDRRIGTGFPLSREFYDQLFLARRESVEGVCNGEGLGMIDLANTAKLLGTWVHRLERD